jgi:hypothetical protein
MEGETMTEQQQRIAIAEFCHFVKPYGKGELLWKTADGRNIYFDPLNDLNAMHEAMLLHPRKELLRDFLYLEVLEDPTNTTNEPAWATAKQWAKAYITSLGKWIE